MRNILLTTVTALLLASCGVYKPYSRPEEVKTDGLYGTDIQAEDTASIASLHWSELFTDTRLQSLIRRGLENNNDLNVARLKVVEAEATLMSSRLAYLPSVSLAPQGTLSSFDGSKTTKTYTLAASAEWELDLFGKLTNAKRGARAALEQSRAYRQAVQTQLIATIANSYYNLLMLDVQLDINRCTAESWSESLRTLELQKQFGNTTEAAVQQARANLLTVETNVLTLEQQVKKQENAISLLLGDVPSHIERGTLTEQQFPDTLSVGVPLQLLARRPDIRQAEQKLIAANAKVGVAYTNMFPRLALTGGFGSESTSLSELLKSPYAVMEGALLTPIFGWGKNRAALKAKKAAYEAEVHSYEKAVLEAFKETRNAIVNFNKIKEVYELRANLERSAKSYMDLAQLQYINGVINYLDVLDAQRGYFDAQIGLSNAIRDELIAVVQLYKALGGGWEQNP